MTAILLELAGKSGCLELFMAEEPPEAVQDQTGGSIPSCS